MPYLFDYVIVILIFLVSIKVLLREFFFTSLFLEPALSRHSEILAPDTGCTGWQTDLVVLNRNKPVTGIKG